MMVSIFHLQISIRFNNETTATIFQNLFIVPDIDTFRYDSYFYLFYRLFSMFFDTIQLDKRQIQRLLINIFDIEKTLYFVYHLGFYTIFCGSEKLDIIRRFSLYFLHFTTFFTKKILSHSISQFRLTSGIYPADMLLTPYLPDDLLNILQDTVLASPMHGSQYALAVV